METRIELNLWIRRFFSRVAAAHQKETLRKSWRQGQLENKNTRNSDSQTCLAQMNRKFAHGSIHDISNSKASKCKADSSIRDSKHQRDLYSLMVQRPNPISRNIRLTTTRDCGGSQSIWIHTRPDRSRPDPHRAFQDLTS